MGWSLWGHFLEEVVCELDIKRESGTDRRKGYSKQGTQ